MNRPTNDERCMALLQKHGLDETEISAAMLAAIKEAYIAGLNADCMVLKKSDVANRPITTAASKVPV
jgi:hypothetical protein